GLDKGRSMLCFVPTRRQQRLNRTSGFRLDPFWDASGLTIGPFRLSSVMAPVIHRKRTMLTPGLWPRQVWLMTPCVTESCYVGAARIAMNYGVLNSRRSVGRTWLHGSFRRKA